MYMKRYGMTIPLDGVPLLEHREWIEELETLGYTDLWSSEAIVHDGLTPLALASVWAPSLRLGCAILPVYLRGPALLAMSIASLCQAAPGRFVVGLGSSSNVIVQDWNGIPFEKPYQQTRDMARFLRSALTGARVSEDYETFSVKNFRLIPQVEEQPRILIAALRQGMLRLAGREADGAIINWLSADDVKRVVPYVKEGGEDKEIVARIFVCPTPDAEEARERARFAINSYLNVPVYAAFHEWLGRGGALRDMWDRWAKGDRKGALAAIPDEVVDDLVIHGTPEECRAHIQRYVASGVDTPVLSLMPCSVDPRQASRDLAPSG
ncbi:MAG: LLM class F420-dependent oxidoreductase [Myxococcota bacterium]